MSISTSQNRDLSIDIAKGIGIILVVWGHQFGNCPIYDWIYLFHMPLFFMLSGCFIKDEPFLLYLYKKIRTLIVPFLFFYSSSLLLKVLSLILFYYHIGLPFYLTQGIMAVSFLYIGDIFYKINRKDRVLLIVAFISAPFYFYAGFNDIHFYMFFIDIPSNPIFIIGPTAFGTALTLLISRHVNVRFISRVLSTWGTYSILILGLHTNTKSLDFLCEKLLRITPSLLLHTLGEKYVEGAFKTILCVIFSLIIGYFINRFVPCLIGYAKNDKILDQIKRRYKNENIIKSHNLD